MLKDRIIERIRAHGPLSFEQYMEMCLYDAEEGFFSAGGVRPGTDGDFVTSPEVSPWFGRLLGRWVESQLTDESIVIEVGAGSGSLMAPLIEELGKRGELPEVFAVERSVAAREALVSVAPAATVVENIEDLPRASHAVIVMNEVLDNVPYHLVERSESGWVEWMVVESDDALGVEPVPIGAPLGEWCDRFLGEGSPGLLTAQTGAMYLVDHLMRMHEDVSFCIVDYGAPTTDLARRRREDVVRTFSRQTSGVEWLDDPGASDITVEVNTDVVLATMPVGSSVESQRDFLHRFGAMDVLDALMERSHERARNGDVMGQLEARSDATGLRALIDPAGLGGFVVLTAENPGT